MPTHQDHFNKVIKDMQLEIGPSLLDPSYPNNDMATQEVDAKIDVYTMTTMPYEAVAALVTTAQTLEVPDGVLDFNPDTIEELLRLLASFLVYNEVTRQSRALVAQ